MEQLRETGELNLNENTQFLFLILPKTYYGALEFLGNLLIYFF